MAFTYKNVMGVLLVAVIAPILAAAVPKVRVPTIVFEFVLGVIIGPDVLGWVKIDEPLEVLGLLALGFLLFTAGTEVDIKALRGNLLGRAAVAYALGLAIAFAIAEVLAAADVILTPFPIAVILSATGLGVVLPHFGLESILGAFVAGIVLGDLRRADREDPASSFWPKGDAIGFGFPIPVYFVTSGIRFDLSGLTGSPGAMLRIPLFLLIFLIVRGVPALLCRQRLGPWVTGALAALSATSLSFVITATDIGVRIGKLRPSNAASLQGAALVAMVIFPMTAQALLARQRTAVRA